MMFSVTVWRGDAIFYPYTSTVLSVCVSQKQNIECEWKERKTIVKFYLQKGKY
jgi:hypothetical protein